MTNTDPTTAHIKAEYQPHRPNWDRVIDWTLTAIGIDAAITLVLLLAACDKPVRYNDCAEVRAAGKAPLHQSQPGYTRNLDRDGDGTACQ
jgi:hypothetical protein